MIRLIKQGVIKLKCQSFQAIQSNVTQFSIEGNKQLEQEIEHNMNVMFFNAVLRNAGGEDYIIECTPIDKNNVIVTASTSLDGTIYLGA